MRTKTLKISLALILLLANSSAAMAARTDNSNDNWAAVTALSKGTKLSVKLKNGKKAEGRLSSVSDTTLSLERKNKITDLDQSDISKVYRVIPRSLGKSIAKSSAIGAAIGGGAGAFTGIAIGSYEDIERAEAMAILGLIGAGIGAGIGAVTGAVTGGRDKKELIYESK